MKTIEGRGYCVAPDTADMVILWARREGLYKFKPPPDTRSLRQPVDNQQIRDGKFIYGVDYDYNDHMVFWTERDANQVNMGLTTI